MCRLTHKFAKTGRYASEEENGEDMGQILVLTLFSVLCQKVGTPHPAATLLLAAGGLCWRMTFNLERRAACRFQVAISRPNRPRLSLPRF